MNAQDLNVNLRKILGLPEKQREKNTPQNQARILSERGTVDFSGSYDAAKHQAEYETQEAANTAYTQNNPPAPFLPDYVCGLYYLNDIGGQKICFVFNDFPYVERTITHAVKEVCTPSAAQLAFCQPENMCAEKYKDEWNQRASELSQKGFVRYKHKDVYKTGTWENGLYLWVKNLGKSNQEIVPEPLVSYSDCCHESYQMFEKRIINNYGYLPDIYKKTYYDCETVSEPLDTPITERVREVPPNSIVIGFGSNRNFEIRYDLSTANSSAINKAKVVEYLKSGDSLRGDLRLFDESGRRYGFYTGALYDDYTALPDYNGGKIVYINRKTKQLSFKESSR